MPEYKIKRGDRAEIGILPDREETERPSTPDAARKRGAVFAEDEESPIYRRGRLTVEVFDLGTRLRSVPETVFDANRVRLASELEDAAPASGYFNEYVEVEFSFARPAEVDNSPGGFVRFNLPDAYRDALSGQLLGVAGDALSPFETSEANVTARALPNAMPFPFENNFQLDLIVGEDRYPLANRATFAESDRDFAGDGEDVPPDTAQAWTKREAGEGDDAENWNPYSKGVGSSSEFVSGAWRFFPAINPAFEQGTLRPSRGGSRLAVAHGHNVTPPTSDIGFGLYETFDTSDTDAFKVTREPHFAADEVPFSLPKAKVRLFLVPRFVVHNSGLFNLNNFTKPLGDAFAFVGREPVYPFPPSGDLRSPSRATVDGYLARTPAARETLERLRALYPGSTGVSTPTGTHAMFEYSPANVVRIYLNYSQAGMLVGVVQVGGSRFYVWRKITDAARFAGVFLMTGINVPELLPYF